MQNENKAYMETWKVQSSDEPGFHAVITPDKSACKETQVFRLNLLKGESYELCSDKLEMHGVLIQGAAQLSGHPVLNNKMKRLDAFYIPGNNRLVITAEEDSVFYIAGAVCEGYGKPFFRAIDFDQPVGDIHQIHGTGIAQREVFMTLSDKDEASRLICGVTWGGEGAWTSWPPHQHEKDLEEVYCYFDIPEPHFGLHLSYLKSGEYEDLVAHTVHTGTMVQCPCGYHPTVCTPGIKNSYFWCLGAFSHKSRRYDLAINDPLLNDFNSAR